MRSKSLCLAIVLTVTLTAPLFSATGPRAPRSRDSQPEFTPVERVIRAVKRVVKSLGQPIVPIPTVPSTTT